MDLGLRVGFVGANGPRRLGVGVRAVQVEGEMAGALESHVGLPLDLLVLDARPGAADASAVPELVREARGMGAVIVGHAEPSEHARCWTGLVDVALVDDGTPLVPAVGPVDLACVNPAGWRRVVPEGLAVVGSRDALERWPRALEDLAGSDATVMVDAERHSGESLVAALRPHLGVVDHPDLHAGPLERAAILVTLAAAGVPVVTGPVEGRLRALLGDGLADALAAVSATALEDPEQRERLSVGLRRAAQRDHSTSARWRQIAAVAGIPVPPPPSVSVLLATHRPQYVRHAIAQFHAQRYEPRELVLVLHGDEFPETGAGELARTAAPHVRLVHAPASWGLGDALNAGLAAASGELVAKMDDDDWYGADHLLDLVLARQYSGAELVGKGAEFVYLSELGITLRRFADGGERASRTIGGGTLLIRRADLREAGNWPRVRRGVDQALVDAVYERGGDCYRTHGLGYLLHRRSSGHTWASDVDYFLGQAVVQRRGLDLRLADVAWS